MEVEAILGSSRRIIWEEISDLINFLECFRGPLKTLWWATCGPRAANCPPLPYSIRQWYW